MSQQELSPVEESGFSAVPRRSVLVVSGPEFTYGYVPYTDFAYTQSVLGAIFWICESEKTFDEIWLDTEIPYDHDWKDEEAQKAHEPHSKRDGRLLCDFLEENWELIPDLDTIRILTRNPVHMKYIKDALSGYFNVCINLPKNQSVSSVTKS